MSRLSFFSEKVKIVLSYYTQCLMLVFTDVFLGASRSSFHLTRHCLCSFSCCILKCFSVSFLCTVLCYTLLLDFLSCSSCLHYFPRSNISTENIDLRRRTLLRRLSVFVRWIQSIFLLQTSQTTNILDRFYYLYELYDASFNRLSSLFCKTKRHLSL